MADTYSKLFQTYRKLYADTSNGFHPSDIQKSLDETISAYGDLVARADQAIAGTGGDGLAVQLGATLQSLTTLVARAAEQDRTKIANAAALDQSNYRKLAEVQERADNQLLGSLTTLADQVAAALGSATGGSTGGSTGETPSPEAIARQVESTGSFLSGWSNPTTAEIVQAMADESGVDDPEDEA